MAGKLPSVPGHSLPPLKIHRYYSVGNDTPGNCLKMKRRFSSPNILRDPSPSL
jgi:hypothetical protein